VCIWSIDIAGFGAIAINVADLFAVMVISLVFRYYMPMQMLIPKLKPNFITD